MFKRCWVGDLLLFVYCVGFDGLNACALVTVLDGLFVLFIGNMFGLWVLLLFGCLDFLGAGLLCITAAGFCAGVCCLIRSWLPVLLLYGFRDRLCVACLQGYGYWLLALWIWVVLICLLGGWFRMCI